MSPLARESFRSGNATASDNLSCTEYGGTPLLPAALVPRGLIPYEFYRARLVIRRARSCSGSTPFATWKHEVAKPVVYASRVLVC